MLECRALQQLFTRENGQLIAQAAVRFGPDRQPSLALQLPLGINVTEPVAVRVDAGKEEKLPIQTCANSGCFLTVPLKEPLLAAMRAGKQLRLSLQDMNKRTVTIDLPLLGFSLAFDKAAK
jgi:invasion protein IalB